MQDFDLQAHHLLIATIETKAVVSHQTKTWILGVQTFVRIYKPDGAPLSVPVDLQLYQRFLHSDFDRLLQKVRYLLRQCHRGGEAKRDLSLEILVKRWSYRQCIPGVVYVKSHLN